MLTDGKFVVCIFTLYLHVIIFNDGIIFGRDVDPSILTALRI